MTGLIDEANRLAHVFPCPIIEPFSKDVLQNRNGDPDRERNLKKGNQEDTLPQLPVCSERMNQRADKEYCWEYA